MWCDVTDSERDVTDSERDGTESECEEMTVLKFGKARSYLFMGKKTALVLANNGFLQLRSAQGMKVTCDALKEGNP